MSTILGNPMVMGAVKAGLSFSYTGDYTIREDGVVELKTSGTITFPKEQAIDIFVVGGGGAGGRPKQLSSDVASLSGGGGGGLTKTIKNVKVSGSYQVTIGDGAPYYSYSTSSSVVRGGTTSFGDIISALGGACSGSDNSSSDTFQRIGGAGGSGGGGIVIDYTNLDYGQGGSDGDDGKWGWASMQAQPSYIGAGQGATTREFGETTGKLYAGGGGGGRYVNGTTPYISVGGEGGGGDGAFLGDNYSKNVHQDAVAGKANTGGGGGGGAKNAYWAYNEANGAAGGSGIVCIRLFKESA